MRWSFWTFTLPWYNRKWQWCPLDFIDVYLNAFVPFAIAVCVFLVLNSHRNESIRPNVLAEWDGNKIKNWKRNETNKKQSAPISYIHAALNKWEYNLRTAAAAAATPTTTTNTIVYRHWTSWRRCVKTVWVLLYSYNWILSMAIAHKNVDLNWVEPILLLYSRRLSPKALNSSHA